ncbi:TetR/AcrR family transcriptional regulator C-terminal domain-containing protein [Amycolatopsis nigrescens]|uniref:TetR/AcrR family transcriptional regulator C-terminal domain-containing protein n=1 Tax=Amycolatopsis nigrescens TaxID=381445 RepID=UPI00037C3EB4|nr:TetR/AcrR family transcriptional regulator C-terminal domain-containing protein [Amycolatopsis nigrescens]
MTGEKAPYLRIAEDIQRQIISGELRVGERVPSTRRLVRERGVAMATASKALAVLRQQGWVRAVPGSGTVVNEHARPRVPSGPEQVPEKAPETTLNRGRVVRAAIALADSEGRAALSMRRLAAELGVGVMSLYRHVPDKDELLRLMADAAFGQEELPEPGPAGWRAKLELSARLQWRAYRRHPWLAPIMLNSLVRPPVVASGLRVVDWALRALDGSGLDGRTRLYTAVSLHGYVGGIAASRAFEVESEQDSGITATQRQAADRELLTGLIESGRFPALSGVSGADAPDLDELFEFGLQRQLDGIAALLASRR